MTISLYNASVASYLQTLDAVSDVLEKGRAHFEASKTSLDDIVESRLIDDMKPLRFQVQSTVFHSFGAIGAIKSGVLNLARERPQHDYAGLQTLVDDARTGLRQLTPAEIDSRAGHEVIFEVQDSKRIFAVEDFLLSFSLPNFYFHASTAYDILRSKGVPLGKRDFMGALRLKS